MAKYIAQHCQANHWRSLRLNSKPSAFLSLGLSLIWERSKERAEFQGGTPSIWRGEEGECPEEETEFDC